MLLGLENLKFFETLYRISPLQVSNLLVIWIEFYGGYCRTPNFATVFGNDVIMTLLIIVEVSSFVYVVEHNISYQPYKFQLSTMSGSDFTEGVQNTPPPQCCTGRKKLSAFRVKLDQI